jgi:hypothetical protein
MFHCIDQHLACWLTFSLAVADVVRRFAASRHDCFAFVPEGYASLADHGE